MLKHIDPSLVSDLGLVELARSGFSETYGELWKRHASAVIIATRNFTGFDSEDVAQETFLRIFQQIQAGKGPETAFRAYAIMTARNVATNMARSRSSDELTGVDDAVFEEHVPHQTDTESQVLGGAFTHQVFSKLPTRWQEVLWYRDVEDLPVREFSTYLGMSENSTSALLKRAREGFKQAWIAANLEPGSGIAPDCEWVVERLPQLTRGKSTAATRRKLEAHFKTCARCSILVEESEHIQSKLALVLLPAMLGGPAAAAYKAWLQAGAISTVQDGAITGLAASVLNPGGVIAGQSAAPGGLSGVSLTKAAAIPIGILSAGALIAGIALSLNVADVQKPHPVAQTTTVEEPVALLDGKASQVGDPDTRETEEDAEAAQEEAPTESSSAESAQPLDAPAPVANFPLDAATKPSGDKEPVKEPEQKELILPALVASPVDGVEVGVYPRLVGVGAPNASILLHVANEVGESYDVAVAADGQGRWAYTPKNLKGQLTVSGRQSYVHQGRDHVDEQVVIGTYAVNHGLTIDVQEISPQVTRIRVTGLEAPTKNQVVNIESTTYGVIALNQPATGNGEWEITVPHPRSSLGNLHYWQGDSFTGPKRVWWHIS